jgi:hypothetical protein
MLFAANPNRKFSASLFDEMFDMKYIPHTLKPSGTHQGTRATDWNYQQKNNRRTPEELLNKTTNKKLFEMYSLAIPPFLHNTNKHIILQNIQIIRPK